MNAHVIERTGRRGAPSGGAAGTAAAAPHTAAAATAPDATAAEHRLVVDTPLGSFTLVGNDHALTHLFLPNTGTAAAGSSPGTPPATLQAAAAQLHEYLAGRRTAFDLPLRFPTGTAFQQQVWTALADIPYGETISYAELAQAVGRPSAFRAVGQANGANPLPVFYPCHRVVASGGGIGGYGGGLDLKRRLLALEQGPSATP
ncbi:MAG: methylated-DNA--[protein]-cysteine S-methyltransferase [Acidimicrobiales bacterium]